MMNRANQNWPDDETVAISEVLMDAEELRSVVQYVQAMRETGSVFAPVHAEEN